MNGNEGTRGATILVIEDNVAFSEFLLEFIASIPHASVVGATGSGEMGAALALARQPDLVLVDINLPGINGLEAVRRIKRHCPRTLVAMLTAHDTPEYRSGAAEAGAEEYMLKSDLVTRLPELIERVRSGRDQP